MKNDRSATYDLINAERERERERETRGTCLLGAIVNCYASGHSHYYREGVTSAGVTFMYLKSIGERRRRDGRERERRMVRVTL